MKKIIVASDSSIEADNALAYAAKAAVEKDYELILFSLQNFSIHVLNARLPPNSLDSHLQAKEKQLRKKAEMVAKEFGIKVTPYFTTGIFFEEMERCIAETDADMLVMGMAEKSVEQDMLGNTTTAAISKLKIPVMAIPLGVTYKGIKTIVFACDIERGVHKQVLEKVHKIVRSFGAEMDIFNVTTAVDELSESNKQSIDESMSGVNYYYNDVVSEDVIQAIRDEVVAKKADILIMIPYKYGFWSSLVHKSKTRVMASGSNIPLLSIHL